MGKKTAQKDAIKDTTSDSQVNSCFPYRWPPAHKNISYITLASMVHDVQSYKTGLNDAECLPQIIIPSDH